MRWGILALIVAVVVLSQVNALTIAEGSEYFVNGYIELIDNGTVVENITADNVIVGYQNGVLVLIPFDLMISAVDSEITQAQQQLNYIQQQMSTVQLSSGDEITKLAELVKLSGALEATDVDSRIVEIPFYGIAVANRTVNITGFAVDLSQQELAYGSSGFLEDAVASAAQATVNALSGVEQQELGFWWNDKTKSYWYGNTDTGKITVAAAKKVISGGSSSSVVGKIKSTVSNVVNSVKNAVNNVVNAVSSAASSVTSKVSGAIDKAKQVISKYTGTKAAQQQASQQAQQAVNNAAGNVVNPSLTGIKVDSGSSVSKWLLIGGGFVGILLIVFALTGRGR